MDEHRSQPHRVLYGRRRGKPPRPARQAILDRLLPELAIDLRDAAPNSLDPRQLFGPGVTDVWFEVGFGNGEHLMAQCRANPNIGIIGAEPYLAGVARLVSYADTYRLNNVRIFADDARLLLDVLIDQSLGRLFTLFPDPWPKTRHHKRRFVQPDTVQAVARILKPGGEWRLATDDMSYCRWILRHLIGRSDFAWLIEDASDWRQRSADWPETRYEAKALAEGRAPMFLKFRRQ